MLIGLVLQEPIPDPTPETLAREAETEAVVFAQANEIDRLLQMMQTLDAKRDNLADNDELSELYQQTLSLRPKIVRLIEKYTQKKSQFRPSLENPAHQIADNLTFR